jgi:Fe-S cluster assembly scaffold protein SufB
LVYPLQEQARLNGIAVDAVFDSVSVATTFKEELTKQGIIFCSMSEAIQKHPDLVKKYLGSVIPTTDHFFATFKLCSIYRWIICIHSRGSKMSDGTFNIF